MSRWVGAVFDEVKTMWSGGVSAGQIAQRLGNGFTRSMILGKLNREGLLRQSRANVTEHQTRAQPLAVTPEMAEERRAVAHAPIKRDVLAMACEPMPGALTIPMLDLERNHCRWPLWSRDATGAPDFPHCGLPKVLGSYCAHHAVAAFPPSNIKARAEVGTDDPQR